MRAPTIHGLCLYLGISRETWYKYAKDGNFSDIIKAITDTFYEQKFAGAASGLLKENIIARELGLADRQISDNRNIDYATLTDEQLELIAAGKSINADNSEQE